MKNIALGQYYPAKSIIHSIDPRMKIILAFIYIICSFLCKNIFSFSMLLLSAFLLVLMSKIPLKTVLGAFKPILIIMLFTAVVNIFFTTGSTVLFEWKIIHVYKEGVFRAVFMVVRIISMILSTSIFISYTTTPIMLTDGIERLFNPLKKIKLPVHEFAMMMSIALRFIPTLVDETDKIMTAQKARGADFTNGSLLKRAKALIPILVPLFVSAFKRADELATAMECRCYRGGEGRTRMTVLHYRPQDFVALGVMFVFVASILALNIIKTGFTF